MATQPMEDPAALATPCLWLRPTHCLGLCLAEGCAQTPTYPRELHSCCFYLQLVDGAAQGVQAGCLLQQLGCRASCCGRREKVRGLEFPRDIVLSQNRARGRNGPDLGSDSDLG